MANPNRRGQAGSEVSTGMQGSDYTPWANTSWILPHGLQLQQKVGQAVITNVSASAGTVTYTAANNYSAGNLVSIYDVSPVGYNLQRATIASATSTQFTVTNAATGTFVSGGVAQRLGPVPVTIPDGITWVYAICVGGGGAAADLGTGQGGGGGGVAWGWTLASSTCVIGNGGTGGSFPNVGLYTRYGHIIAGGGGASGASAFLGGAGQAGFNGATNYWGMPGGTASGDVNFKGNPGGGAGGGAGSAINGIACGAAGDGISGGGAATYQPSGPLTNTGGTGGSGLVGGGGGKAIGSTTTNIGGAGGNGINILTGTITTGGTSTTGTGSSSTGAGGGGAGIATKGFNASGTAGGGGGLGGGGGGCGNPAGNGGDGIVYLFY